MSKVEEFYRKWYKETQGIEVKEILCDEIDTIKFAEAYHKSRIEEVPKQVIKYYTNGMLTDAFNEGFANGWNRLKEDLLKE